MITKNEFIKRLDLGVLKSTIISSLNNNTEHNATINNHINQAWNDYNFGLEIISRVPARTPEEADLHMKAYRRSPLYQQSGESELAMHFVDVNNIADQLLYQILAIDNSLMEKIEKSKSSRLWNAVFKPKFNINQEIYDATQVIIPAESKEALGLLIDLPMMRVKHDSIELYSTPLMTEISNTHTTGALFLINAGADVNKFAVAFGNNPLLLAISKGWNHRDTDGKENTKDSFDELHYAFTQKDIIHRLLKHPDLDANAQHLGNGMSALHIACLRGDSLDLPLCQDRCRL